MPVLPEDVQSVVESAERTDNLDELKPLGQDRKDSYEGDFVLSHQETSKTHRNVSQIWMDQCMTYDQGREVLADQQSNIADIRKPLGEFEPVVEDGQFGLRDKRTLRVYRPTDHAMTQLMSVIPKDKGSAWLGKRLLAQDVEHPTKEDVVLWQRDERDAEVLRHLVELVCFQPDRVDLKKVRLFRTWDNDNSLRAVLSKDYTIVNNGWFLDTVARILPGGMLSHWYGDADAIFGNVLSPDSIREEDDSPYGGMFSIGNSEIGTRRITGLASVFRAICMNGCIWDQELGKGIDQVHRKKEGKIDLPALAERIKQTIERQIPLIDAGIRQVLSTKEFGFDNVEPSKVIAATIQKMKIPKKMAKGIVQAYGTEQPIVGDSAFTVMQSLTRYGQTFRKSPLTWVDLDEKAGRIARMNRNEWDRIVALAKTFDDKELEKLGVA